MAQTRTFILAVLLAGILFPATAPAAPDDRTGDFPDPGPGKASRRCDDDCKKAGRRPYGDYCCNKQRGWYGARREVTSEQQARAILVDYFAGRQVTIGPFRERPMFFAAEIFDANGKLVDKVIVHKRSGRIRSIY